MYSVFDIAEYFLFLGDRNDEEHLSNMKLQKLCYYAKGFYLALHNISLFNNDIKAWQHGPVVVSLYEKYRDHGSRNISASEDFSIDIFPSKIKVFLNHIYLVYGKYSAWGLSDMTHEESPWINAFDTKSKLISDTELISFFQNSNKFQYFKDHIEM